MKKCGPNNEVLTLTHRDPKCQYGHPIKGRTKGTRGVPDWNVAHYSSTRPQSSSVVTCLVPNCTFGTDRFSSCITPFWFPVLWVGPISVRKSWNGTHVKIVNENQLLHPTWRVGISVALKFMVCRVGGHHQHSIQFSSLIPAKPDEAQRLYHPEQLGSLNAGVDI